MPKDDVCVSNGMLFRGVVEIASTEVIARSTLQSPNVTTVSQLGISGWGHGFYRARLC